MEDAENCRIRVYVREDGKKYSEFDTLGFDATREAFVKVIKSVVSPLTIGLYGSWGSGKTEMIKALEEDLKNSDYLTLIFDAWKYKYESNLILPLICALQRKHLSKIEDVKDSAKKIVASVAMVMVNQFLKNKIGVDVGGMKMALETYEGGYKHYKKYDDEVASIEKEFKDFIGVLLDKTMKKKLIVFIDNLDRCLPDTTVNLLEDISSFLSIQGVPCVYILVMDKENAIKAINHRYPDFNGMHYLEKIVHIGLKMPLPRKREDHDSSYGLYHFFKRYEQGHGSKRKSELKEASEVLHNKLISIDNVFKGDLLGNPRRVEHMVNKIIMLEAMKVFRPEDSPEDFSILIFLLLLCEFFPRVYDFINDIQNVNYLTDIINSSRQKETMPALKKDSPSPIDRVNKVIFDAYCSDEKFYKFVRHFSILAQYSYFRERFFQIKSYLNYIG